VTRGSLRFGVWGAVAITCVCGLVRSSWAGDGGGTNRSVSFSGYGEMHYNAPSNGTAELDFHRLVLGFAASLSDAIGFHAELDFEHAFTEPEMEFAYLDFLYRDELSFRTGLVLMPVGPLNEFHEPPLFYSVERPYVQKDIVPTTWQEPGAGIVGTALDAGVSYRAYAVGGLFAAQFGSGGIRGGRQRGAEASAEDIAVVGRVEYAPSLGVSLAASGYAGGAAQGVSALGDASVAIAEVDARLEAGGVEASAMYAAVFIGGADSISAFTGEVVGERLVGFTGELAFHVLRILGTRTERDLVAFARVELLDTQDRVPDGLLRDPSLDRRVVTMGASFLPVPSVALKADVELWESDDGAAWEQFNLGVGFMY